LTVALKSAEPGEGFDEDFLGNFLGILRMKNHPQSDVVNPCLMPEDQFFQRLPIAVLSLKNQVQIVRFVNHFGKRIEHGCTSIRSEYPNLDTQEASV
jgi:hypothetical protein